MRWWYEHHLKKARERLGSEFEKHAINLSYVENTIIVRWKEARDQGDVWKRLTNS